MTSASRADLVRRRLTSAGISAEECERYTSILRQFLSARLTKVRFETEMLKVIPREKIFVHNAIIRELLHRAQQKREGVPDLPLVTPILDKPKEKPVRPVAATPAFRAERAANRKRPREQDTDAEQRANGPIPGAPPKPQETTNPEPVRRPQEKVSQTVSEVSRPPPSREPPAPAPPVPATVRAAPTPAAVARPGSAPMLHGNDVSTYNGIPFFPLRPGHGMDLDLFLKLRQRMKDHVVEHMGMSGVKDDAVALVMHALELHIKSLMESGARQRAARQVMRPHGKLQCGPVLGHDFREAALRNFAAYGDDAGVEIERLSLLLF